MSFGCLGLHLWPHLLDRQLLDLPQAQRLARQSLQAPKAAEAVHGTAWGEALGERPVPRHGIQNGWF